jgi:hypothetical protein
MNLILCEACWDLPSITHAVRTCNLYSEKQSEQHTCFGSALLLFPPKFRIQTRTVFFSLFAAVDLIPRSILCMCGTTGIVFSITVT